MSAEKTKLKKLTAKEKSTYLYHEANLWRSLFASSYGFVLSQLLIASFGMISYTFMILFCTYATQNIPAGNNSADVTRLIFQFADPFFFFAYAVNFFAYLSWNVLGSKAHAQKDRDGKINIFQHLIIFLLIVNLTIAGLLFIFAPEIIYIQDPSISKFILNKATHWSRIIILGQTFLSLSSFFCIFLQFNLRTHWILITNFVLCIVTTFFDYLLLGILKLNNINVTAYTIIASWILGAITFFCFFWFQENKPYQYFNFKKLDFKWKIITTNLSIAIWPALNPLAIAAVGIYFNFLLTQIYIYPYARNGTKSFWIGLFSVSYPFISILFSPFAGFANAVSSFLSYCVSAKLYKRFYGYLRRALLSAAIAAAIEITLFLSLLIPIFHLYGVTDSRSLNYGILMGVISFCCFIFYMVMGGTRGAFQALNKKVWIFVSYSLHNLFFYPIFALIFFWIAKATNEPLLIFLTFPVNDFLTPALTFFKIGSILKAIKANTFDWSKTKSLSEAY